MEKFVHFNDLIEVVFIESLKRFNLWYTKQEIKKNEKDITIWIELNPISDNQY